MEGNEMVTSTLEGISATISVVSIKSGDVIVLMTDKILSAPQIALAAEIVGSVMPKGVKVLVLDSGAKLAVIQKG